MRVESRNYQYKYNKPITFKGFNVQSFGEFMGISADEFVKNGHKIIDNAAKIVKEKTVENPFNQKIFDSVQKLYEEYQRENEQIFRAALKPKIVEIAQKIIDLPTYDNFLLPYIAGKKRGDLEYLYKLAKSTDILGEMRIPGEAFPNFSEIPYERLKMLEPVILSKNDMGLWNYSPSFIWYLDNKYSDKQIEIMSRLAKYKVNGLNLKLIAEHPYLNHWSIVEKAKRINELFGKKLREIEFLSTSKGENYISVDVALEHKDTVPDYLNFKRLYARVETNTQPKDKKHSVSEIDKYVHNLYSKLEDKLVVFNSEKLDFAIKEVMKNVPDADETEVLRVMQKLTQFSNYSSLKQIEKELSDAKIHKISINGGINYIFNYFSKTKSIINLAPQKGERYEGLFITKEDLNDTNLRKGIKAFALYDDIKFINLEGWSDGVNLLSDDNLLTEKTVKVLKKVRKLTAKHPEFTFNEALDKVLNGDIESYLAQNGIGCVTVKTDAPATRQVILEQMLPIMPTESLLKSTIESVANHYTKDKKKFTDLALRIAKYYDENIEIYSKQRMIENLKDLKTQAEKFIHRHNIKKENVYITVPMNKNEIKSFDIIGKMFSKVLGIPRDRVLRLSSCNQIEKLPKNSVCIIADDIAASGFSMAEALGYSKTADELSTDKHILFCPITATTSGIDYIQTMILNMCRKGLDDILYVKNSIKSHELTAEKFIGDEDVEFYKKVFGFEEEQFSSYGMCTSFPYMAPDNNSVLSGFLLKHFTPDKNCIKSKSHLISVIEKDTYYYDIFGTSENRVLTRLDFHKSFTDKIKDLLCDIFQRNRQ